MDTKIVLFTIILLITICSVSMVSAAEEINLLGIDFSIPDGYKESPNGANMTNYVNCIYQNELNTSDIIQITVDDKAKDFEKYYKNSSKYEKTTIGGHEGYKYSYLNEMVFEYLADGKTVKIEAKNENIIESIIN